PLATQTAPAGRDARGPAVDPRGGAPPAKHALEHNGGTAADRREPGDRAAEAERAVAGRAGLDRDEGPGERPRPPLRDRQRVGDRPEALPCRRARAGLPALGILSLAKVRPAEPGRPGDGDAARL